MKLRDRKGFALVEVVVAMGFLLAIVGGVLLKMNSVQSHIRQTEKILSADNLEQNLMELVSDYDTLIYSVNQRSNAGLRSCLLNENSSCRSGQSFRQDFYLEGERVPFTGANVYYDFQGNRCDGPCDGFRLITFVTVRCARGNLCNQPDHSTVRYDIYASGEEKPIRRDFVDIKRYSQGRFPGVNLACRSPQQVLRGIGINGRALCVNRNQIKLKSSSGEDLSGNFNVTPRDCSQLNQAEKDQSFVVGITKEGALLCGEKFW
ncbi:MAG: type II secretion system protein [Oligoflexus sp.]